MPLQITKSKVESLMKRADALQAKVKTASKKTEEIVMSLVETGVTYGSAGAFGYLDGRFGGAEVFGMPGDLLAAGLLHVAGYLEVGGASTSRFFHAAGNGAAANHAHNLGASVGRIQAIRAKELNPITGKRKGQTGFVAPTDEEIKSVVSGDGQRMLTDSEMGAFARGV